MRLEEMAVEVGLTIVGEGRRRLAVEMFWRTQETLGPPAAFLEGSSHGDINQ